LIKVAVATRSQGTSSIAPEGTTLTASLSTTTRIKTDWTTTNVYAIEITKRIVSVCFTFEIHETKALRTTRITVSDNPASYNTTSCGECATQVFFRSRESETSYENRSSALALETSALLM